MAHVLRVNKPQAQNAGRETTVPSKSHAIVRLVADQVPVVRNDSGRITIPDDLSIPDLDETEVWRGR
jgi:hypothetical protein